MSATIYILQFNSEILLTSVNLTVLHSSMCNRCGYDCLAPPKPYHTVRRLILAEGKYVHEPMPGWAYRILEKPLAKKPLQYKHHLFNDTVEKQR